MRTEESPVAFVASRMRGTGVPPRSPKSKFGEVAELLWPQKTIAELAFRGGVSERAAKYWMAGKRRPSTRILTEVMRELDQ
jgi:hypothetical protein